MKQPLPLKVTGVQTKLKWEDPKANRSHIEALIPKDLETDLIVLPEMFTTGFTMKPEQLAEPHSENMVSLEWMRKLAKKYQAAICGSISVRLEETHYNRFYFVKPDGSYEVYDKQMLFNFAHEDDHYSPGNSPKVVSWKDWSINLSICFDLRFPEAMRNGLVNGSPLYDLQIVVANWPAVRRAPWMTLLQARAIENQCYLIGVNRVGADGNGIDHSGDSMILDSKGKIGHHFSSSEEEVSTKVLDFGELAQFRERFQVLMQLNR